MKKLFTLIALLCAITASADTQTLQPTGVFTWTNEPAITYDASATSWTINQGGVSGGKIGRYAGPYAIVKFDASGILDGKTLVSAKLNFTIPKASYNTSLNIAQMADATFDPATVTTATFDASATQFQAGDWSSKTADTDFSYDVTTRVENSKVIAFAIYCNTGREQTLKNVALEVEYSATPVQKFQYSLTAVDASSNVLKELAAGEEIEGKTVDAYFPMTFAKDGKLYTTTQTPFNVSLDKDNKTKTVAYAEAASDIVAFVEGEAGAVNSKDNGAYSNGKTGHAAGGKSVTIATLPAGKYKAIVKFEANGNRSIYLRNTAVSDVNNNVVVIMPIDKNSKAGDFTSDEFTLTEETTIGFTGYTSGSTTNQSADIDYIYIVKTGEATVPVTISDAGYATFVAPYDVDFTGNAIEAFYVSDDNSAEGTVTLTKVNQVPAGEAVIVKGATGNVNVVASAEPITNRMKAATTDIAYDADATTINYVLAQGENGVGLYPVTSGTIAAGKGYLPVAKKNAAKGGFTFVTDNVTAVEMAEAAPAAVKNGKFATAEGIVIVKDGVKYNVAGMKK